MNVVCGACGTPFDAHTARAPNAVDCPSCGASCPIAPAWLVKRRDGVLRPFDGAQALQQAVIDGALDPEDQLSRDGVSWKPLRSIEKIAKLFSRVSVRPGAPSGPPRSDAPTTPASAPSESATPASAPSERAKPASAPSESAKPATVGEPGGSASSARPDGDPKPALASPIARTATPAPVASPAKSPAVVAPARVAPPATSESPTGRPAAAFATPTTSPLRAPTPVPAPAASPVLAPTPAANPLRAPTPAPVPAASPLRAPTPAPMPAASPLRAPTPVPAASPLRAPTPAPIATPQRAPTPAASPLRAPTPAPGAMRAPTPAPVPSALRSPTPAFGASAPAAPRAVDAPAATVRTPAVAKPAPAASASDDEPVFRPVASRYPTLSGVVPPPAPESIVPSSSGGFDDPTMVGTPTFSIPPDLDPSVPAFGMPATSSAVPSATSTAPLHRPAPMRAITPPPIRNERTASTKGPGSTGSSPGLVAPPPSPMDESPAKPSPLRAPTPPPIPPKPVLAAADATEADEPDETDDDIEPIAAPAKPDASPPIAIVADKPTASTTAPWGKLGADGEPVAKPAGTPAASAVPTAAKPDAPTSPSTPGWNATRDELREIGARTTEPIDPLHVAPTPLAPADRTQPVPASGSNRSRTVLLAAVGIAAVLVGGAWAATHFLPHAASPATTPSDAGTVSTVDAALVQPPPATGNPVPAPVAAPTTGRGSHGHGATTATTGGATTASTDPTARAGRALIDQGRAALARGDTVHAEQAFRAMLTAHPNDPEAETGLGHVAIAQAQFSQALQYFDRAIHRDANYADAYVGQGDAYARLGRDTDAIHAYENYLARRPRGPYAHRARSAIDQLQRAAHGRH